MFRALRNRIHVSPATAIATVALVFAMTGGAYAASKYLITSTKQISPKVLKSLKGKPGPAGANGANGAGGPAGPTGPAGGTGAAGTNGTNGTNGEPGKPGESVTSKEKAIGQIGKCAVGGSEFTVGGKATYACNGTPGAIHPGETLPPGASETGVWDMPTRFTPPPPSGEEVVFIPISFPIPLKAALDAAHVHFIELFGGTPPAGCKGNSENLPLEAEPGNLCIWGVTTGNGGARSFTSSINSSLNVEAPSEGAGKNGAILTGAIQGEENVWARGDWVVSGP
jgi:hypothetical protein